MASMTTKDGTPVPDWMPEGICEECGRPFVAGEIRFHHFHLPGQLYLVSHREGDEDNAVLFHVEEERVERGKLSDLLTYMRTLERITTK